MQRLVVVVRSLVVAVTLSLACQGCVLVPFVQAFKESGFTENDRMSLLPARIKKFSDAQLFGNRVEALELVAPEARNEIGRQLSEKPEQQRIVKSWVDQVEWFNDAHEARVIVKVDSFKMSQLVVNTTTEEQTWEFSTATGWLLKERNAKQS